MWIIYYKNNEYKIDNNFKFKLDIKKIFKKS